MKYQWHTAFLVRRIKMRFWDERKELEIVNEDKNVDNKYVKHMLYEQNFIIGMKSIFKMALKNGEMQENANILTFIGKRGSGKTTAMNEFCEILKGMQEKDNKEYWISKAMGGHSSIEKLRNYSFYFRVLDPIDASLVEDREELFELILAKLYKVYSERLNNFDIKDSFGIKNKEIIKKFEELLQMYQFSKAGERKEKTAFSTLIQNMGGSGEIAGKVSVLIDELLKIEERNSSHEYLVITIDDLDLNIKNGYKMLEQLQKYFVYHKIIILITVDYDQMVLVCTKHFMNELETGRGNVNNKNDENLGDNIEIRYRTLVNDYMIKVFPLEHRMYMPDMRKLTKKSMIMLEGESEGQTIQEKEGCRIKEFLMYKVAESMRIYYDICGMKYHFCEPNTVRTLVEYNNFLNDLDNRFRIESDQLIGYNELLGKDEKEREKIIKNNLEILRSYDGNHERFNWDIMKRLAQTTLNQYQDAFFKKLMERNLERRAMYFVSSEKCGKEIIMQDINPEQYTYGDLLQKLYEWGRKYYDDKPLMSCVIASFTSEMVREYIFYRYLEENNDKRLRSLERLERFLGNTFSNRWINNIFPQVWVVLEYKMISGEFGYIEKIENSAFRIEYDMEDLKELSRIKIIMNNRKNIENILEKWLKKTSMVPVLECLGMFLSCKEEEDKFQFIIKISEMERAASSEKENMVFAVELGEGQYSLDMLGFVKNSLRFEERKKRLHSDIVKGILEMILWENKITKNGRKILEDAIQKVVKGQSLLEKYKSDGEAAFPFYNLDLSYNVIKRVRRNRDKKKEFIMESQMLNEIRDVYLCIKKELKEQDKLYAPVTNQIKYGDIFENNPYIHMICEIIEKSADDEKCRDIAQQLQFILSSIIRNAEKSDIKQPELPQD